MNISNQSTKKQYPIPLKSSTKLYQMVILFLISNFFLINFIERPEIQSKKMNLVSVQNKMELTTLNTFLKSKFILFINMALIKYR